MVTYSRFAHKYDLEDVVALYHSLRMKPVYLKKDTYESLHRWLASSSCLSPENAPNEISTEVSELLKYKVLTSTADEDARVLEFIRSRIPRPAINVCYMILSEQCNLACKYCFFGEQR